jgi:hypothetical protein
MAGWIMVSGFLPKTLNLRLKFPDPEFPMDEDLVQAFQLGIFPEQCSVFLFQLRNPGLQLLDLLLHGPCLVTVFTVAVPALILIRIHHLSLPRAGHPIMPGFMSLADLRQTLLS